MAPPPTDRGRLSLALLLVLLVVVKGSLLLSRADVFYFGEELEKGAVAKALVDGLHVTYSRLPYHPYEGGGFVVSHLEALAFLALGPSVLAQKVVALGFCAAVLAAGFALLRRHVSGRAAVLFGLLFVFGPESFQKLTLLALGIHFEACLFVLLVLDRTLRLAFAEPRDPADGYGRDWALLGLVGGFGLYFSYQLVVVLAVSALTLLCVRPRSVLGAPGVLGLAGFVLGAGPFWAMWAAVGAEVFDVHGTGLVEGGETTGLLGEFVRSLGRGGVLAAGLRLLPLAALLASIAVLARASRRAEARRLLPLLAFLVAWLVVYLASGFVVGAVGHHFHYLRFAPVWIVGTLLVAAVLGGGEGTGARGRIGLACAGALLLVGVGHTVRIVLEARPLAFGEAFRVLAGTKGYDYAGYFAKLCPRLERSPEDLAVALAGFDEPARDLLRGDVASAVFDNGKLSLDDIRAVLDGVDEAADPAHRHDYLVGLGPWLRKRANGDLGRALEIARGAPEPQGEALLEALGRFGVAFADSIGRLEADCVRYAELEVELAVWRGTGARLFRRMAMAPWGRVEFNLRPAALLERLGSLPVPGEDARRALRTGFEEERARWHL